MGLYTCILNTCMPFIHRLLAPQPPLHAKNVQNFSLIFTEFRKFYGRKWKEWKVFESSFLMVGWPSSRSSLFFFLKSGLSNDKLSKVLALKRDSCKLDKRHSTDDKTQLNPAKLITTHLLQNTQKIFEISGKVRELDNSAEQWRLDHKIQKKLIFGASAMIHNNLWFKFP